MKSSILVLFLISSAFAAIGAMPSKEAFKNEEERGALQSIRV
jgi:hypothetical protein